MKTKEEAMELTAEKWDNVIDDRGAVCVVIGQEKNIESERKKLKRYMKKIGYNRSYGVKRKQDVVRQIRRCSIRQIK